MRLFTAAVPPTDVADHLESALVDVPMDYRAPRAAWHITLGYYGEEDPSERVPWVHSRVAGLVPPRVSRAARVSLGEMSNFGATLLMLVSPADDALGSLAAALRWDDKHPVYTPHLTVGKGVPVRLGYAGPEWTVDEVCLLGAERRHEYTVLDRVSLLS